MDLYDQEVKEARRMIAAAGLREETFSLHRSDMPPDPDEAADSMFTMRYEIVVSCTESSVECRYIGGIGLNWLTQFESDLRAGSFTRRVSGG